MSSGGHFGRFDLQVRMVLLLLVLFLGVVALMNVFVLGWARETVDDAARERAVVSARELAGRLGPALLAEGSVPPTPTYLRREAVRSGFRSVRIVDPRSGLPTAVSAGERRDGLLARLPPADREGLASGRVATLRLGGSGGLMGGRVVFHPILDRGGALHAVVEARADEPNLARLERWIGRLRAIQIVGVLVVAVVAIGFGNWVSRPYRRIAAVAGAAGLRAPEGAGSLEPDELVGAFRAMVERMREQDRALGTVERGSGGLGDLVRFASHAARDMATGVVVLDRRRRIAAMNGAAAALLAIDARTATGQTIEAVFPSMSGLPRLLADCLERGRPATREVLRARWPSGREGHFGVTLSPSPGVDDRPTGALMLMTDLTEIQELQQQAQVRENLAAVGEVSAGIAHEIRNALGTILANARLLEKRDDPLAAGPARAIVREVEGTADVIEEFLMYARPAPPKPVTFDLRIAIVRASAAAPDAIDVHLEGEFGPVHADETLVTRAFDNLFRNAGDVARESGRRLSVTARGRRVADGRWVQVELEDDGPGIPDDDLDRVFTPFYTSRSRGTGLGLASVRRTLSDLGGSIEAARGSAGGALFRLRFPLAVPNPAPPRPGCNETVHIGRPAGVVRSRAACLRKRKNQDFR